MIVTNNRILMAVLEFLRNLNVKQKLLLSYFILIIIPLGLLTLLSYSKNAEIIEKHMVNSVQQALEQANSFLGYKMENINEISDIIITSNDIQTILSKPLESYSISEQIDDERKLWSLITNLQKNRDVYRIRLYVKDGLMYSNEKVNFFNLAEIKEAQWFEKTYSLNGKVLWLPTYTFNYLWQNQQRIISACRLIKDAKGVYDYIGVVSIDILEENIREIISKAVLTDRSEVYLVSGGNDVICTSNNSLEDSVFPYAGSFKEILDKGLDWGKFKVNNKEYMLAHRDVAGMDWKLISVTPLSEILSSRKTYQNYILIMMFIIGMLAYLIAYYISVRNTSRIRKIIKTMEEVKKGNLDVAIDVDSNDEIGNMEAHFNEMVAKMKQQVAEMYKMGIELKNTELKALQAQINPHFLYNTLDLINWMAIDNNTDDIRLMVNSLAKFYKLSLNKGRDLVPIADEIAHVETYFRIQNKRFDERISLEIDMEESIYQYSILKLVLQPLVENSILHGLTRSKKHLTIKITGKINNDIISISVWDDGVGMEAKKLESIIDSNRSNPSNGYGIGNINNRLKLFYGEEYGVFYTSEPGKWTCAEIRVPKVLPANAGFSVN